MLLFVARGTSALLLTGLLLRLTVRDGIPFLAALYYGLPLPVLLVLAGVTCLLWRRRKHRIAARFGGLATLAVALWCVAALGRWHPPSDHHAEPIRILCWNTCRGLLGWERVADAINEMQPDIVGLVEAGESSHERRKFWRQSCPGYHVSLLGEGFVCLTKEPAGDAVAVRLPVQGEYRRLEVPVGTGRLTLLIVDLKSNPFRSRKECLRQLAADADDLADRPVVVLGDFNTPADSVHFTSLRERHRHAFESAGKGYLATWPVPLPVLGLDHIWANSRVRIASCRHAWSPASDHRPVVAEVTIVPSGAAEDE